MKKAELGMSLFLATVGAAAFIISLNYKYSSALSVGPGFFPRWASSLLFVFSVINFFLTLKKYGGISSPTFFSERGDLYRLLSFYAAMILYVYAVTQLGMLISTTAFMILVYRFFDKFDWRQVLLPTTGIMLFIYVVFQKLLHLRLPGGFWS
jgi:hypothetical protein